MTFDLHQGEALALLRRLPSESVDALVTDPPYSSGGFTRSDRSEDPTDKYVHTTVQIVRNSFSGDNRDARSWCYWMALWLSEANRVCREGAYALVFTDWRQLPLAADSFQAGGFMWRGIVAWDKTEGARAPHTGYFRHQCEYVVWGSKGPLAPSMFGGPFPGVYRCPVLQSDKHHLTGKPTALMLELLQCVAASRDPGPLHGQRHHGGPGRRRPVILDPFMGSGTTAAQEGGVP